MGLSATVCVRCDSSVVLLLALTAFESSGLMMREVSHTATATCMLKKEMERAKTHSIRVYTFSNRCHARHNLKT